jgi:hypothetical protein
MEPVTVGRIVIYKLSKQNVSEIYGQRLRSGPGNPIQENLDVPLIVTAVWPEEFGPGKPGINGQAILDGNDTLWVKSVCEGSGPGTWHWPVRSVPCPTER